MMKKTSKDLFIHFQAKLKRFACTCHQEINRTTKIGQRMISASKINSHLHQNYEELGRSMARAYQNGQIEFPNAQSKSIYYQIVQDEKELQEIQREINKIKFSSGPDLIRVEDHSKDQNLH